MYPDGDPGEAVNVPLGPTPRRRDPQMKPFGLAPDADGNIWAVNNRSSSLSVISPKGKLIDSLPGTYRGRTVLTHPIANAADLKGIKWRAYSPATARIGELVGAQPVTVQAAEVSQAFATGVVESMMSSGSTGWDAKLHEHVKYWYDTQAWLPKNAVIVNKAAFDALDPATRQAVLKAGADAEARGWTVSKAKNDEYKELLKKNGMNIVAPPAALTADMKKVGETMLKEWLEKAGPEGQAVIDAFRK